MTEKQAWLAIAESFESGAFWDGIWMNRYGRYGICAMIDKLRFLGDIDRGTYVSMYRKIPEPTGPHAPYLWPRTPEGARERVKFCQERADECE